MTAFESDGVYTGIPYRVLSDSSIEAMLPGGLVKFKNMDQFLAAAAAATDINSASRLITSPDLAGNTNRQRANIPASVRPLDYYSILLEAIHKAERNSAQLRALIYERARFNLKREFLFGNSSLGLPEIMQHVNDFELAIARIEANAVDAEPGPTFPEPVELRETNYAPSDGRYEIMPPSAAPPIYEDFPSYKRAENRELGWQSAEIGKYLRAATMLLGSSLVAILLIGAIMAAAMWHSSKKPSQIEIANNLSPSGEKTLSPNDSNGGGAKTTDVPSKPPFPVPTAFGIYALSDNKLIKLETLPIKVPDLRVALSAEITKPSNTTISGNQPAFILFRRDLLNNAPEKVTLRVIAQVMRDTKFVGNKPTVINLQGSWRVRNISREYKISPIVGQPEMVMAQADDNLPLAAGRYALVVNGLGYDFTIEGATQSLAHCLEKFEALNGTVFSECRNASTMNHTSSKL